MAAFREMHQRRVRLVRSTPGTPLGLSLRSLSVPKRDPMTGKPHFEVCPLPLRPHPAFDQGRAMLMRIPALAPLPPSSPLIPNPS
jgi:hypothetical protein